MAIILGRRGRLESAVFMKVHLGLRCRPIHSGCLRLLWAAPAIWRLVMKNLPELPWHCDLGIGEVM